MLIELLYNHIIQNDITNFFQGCEKIFARFFKGLGAKTQKYLKTLKNTQQFTFLKKKTFHSKQEPERSKDVSVLDSFP